MIKEKLRRLDLIDLNKPILVSMENFTELTDAKVVSEDGKDWHIPLMNFDQRSRNNNLYPGEDTMRSIKESKYVQENLRNHTLFSELEHPQAGNDLKRFLFVEPTRYAANIRKIYYYPDHLEGDITLCAQLGLSIVLPNVKAFGSNYAASCRIYTPHFIERNDNGKKIFVKKYPMYPITWDIVSMPGFEDCRLVDKRESTESYYDGYGAYGQPKANAKGSINSIESCQDILFSNPGSIMQEIMESNEGFSVLEDYFESELHLINDTFKKGGAFSFSTDDGIKIDIPLNRLIIDSILK